MLSCLHVGKDDSISTELGMTSGVVLRLVEPICGRGHHLYTDNLYTSPSLFTELRLLGIGACGTLRMNRRGIPPEAKASLRRERREQYHWTPQWTLFSGMINVLCQFYQPFTVIKLSQWHGALVMLLVVMKKWRNQRSLQSTISTWAVLPGEISSCPIMGSPIVPWNGGGGPFSSLLTPQ